MPYSDQLPNLTHLNQITQKASFKTGRFYDKEQVLNVYVIGTFSDFLVEEGLLVAFVDESRHLDGIFPIDELTVQECLRAYDLGYYHHLTPEVKKMISDYETGNNK